MKTSKTSITPIKRGAILLQAALYAFLSCSAAFALTYPRSWYVERARENVRIRNYKAAIEAYNKAYEMDSKDPIVMKELSLAYEVQGLIDKSIEFNDRYLAVKQDDAEMYFKQAKVLSGERYAYRRKDAIEYYRRGLELRDDPVQRMAYAEVLAAEKETSGAASQEYKQILKKDPGNQRAQKGLANAEAWIADYGGLRGRGDVAGRPVLSQARPEAGLGFRFFNQSGGNFGYNGFGTVFHAGIDPNRFITLRPEVQLWHFWNSPDTASGSIVSLAGQYRINPYKRVELQAGMAMLGNDNNTPLVKAQYEWEKGPLSFRHGFRRELKWDSLVSLVGREFAGQRLGKARSHDFYTDVTYQRKGFSTTVSPHLGWVTSESQTENWNFGAEGQATQALPVLDSKTLYAGYYVGLARYDRDASGITNRVDEPLPGGYFSPHLFFSQTPKLMARRSWGPQSLEFSAGPSLQYVKTASNEGVFQGGAEAYVTYRYQWMKRLEFTLSPGYLQIADVYRNFFTNLALVYSF